MSRNRLFALAVVGALALGLAACVPDFGFGQGGAGGSSGGGTAGTASPTPGASSAETEGDGAMADADPVRCLLGAWRADNDFFLAALRQYGDQVTAVNGRVTVTFAEDGTFTTSYAGWTITAVEEGVEVTVRRDGLDSGEYSATATTVSLRDTSIGSTLVMTGQGFEMVVDPVAAVYTDASYTCDASSAVITTTDGPLQMKRE